MSLFPNLHTLSPKFYLLSQICIFSSFSLNVLSFVSNLCLLSSFCVFYPQFLSFVRNLCLLSSMSFVSNHTILCCNQLLDYWLSIDTPSTLCIYNGCVSTSGGLGRCLALGGCGIFMWTVLMWVLTHVDVWNVLSQRSHRYRRTFVCTCTRKIFLLVLHMFFIGCEIFDILCFLHRQRERT